MASGCWDGSVGEGTCCQAWRPEVDPQNPHGGRRTLTGFTKGIHLNPFVNNTKQCDIVTGSYTVSTVKMVGTFPLWEAHILAWECIAIPFNKFQLCSLLWWIQESGAHWSGSLWKKALRKRTPRLCASVLTTCWQSRHCQDCVRSLSQGQLPPLAGNQLQRLFS